MTSMIEIKRVWKRNSVSPWGMLSGILRYYETAITVIIIKPIALNTDSNTPGAKPYEWNHCLMANYVDLYTTIHSVIISRAIWSITSVRSWQCRHQRSTQIMKSIEPKRLRSRIYACMCVPCNGATHRIRVGRIVCYECALRDCRYKRIFADINDMIA